MKNPFRDACVFGWQGCHRRQPHMLWQSVGCHAGERRDATGQLLLPSCGGSHWTLPPQLTCAACRSSAHEGIPQSSSLYPAQIFPNQEEAEPVSCTPVARSCAGWDPHFPGTDNHKWKFKGKNTYSHLKSTLKSFQ